MTSPLMMPLSVMTNGNEATATITASTANGHRDRRRQFGGMTRRFHLVAGILSPPHAHRDQTLRPQVSTTNRMTSEIALENSEEM